jgi:hypothetical protein
VSINRSTSDFLKKRYNFSQIDTISISATASNTGEWLHFCDSYLMDGNFTVVCASISLITRWITVDYVKVGVVAT